CGLNGSAKVDGGFHGHLMALRRESAMPGGMSGNAVTAQRFCLILVKPSHYDDDGYVIQWHRSSIPSNSLASLFGLAKDCAERRILGDMAIDIHAFDETNTRIRPNRLAAMIEQAGGGMVMLVG